MRKRERKRERERGRKEREKGEGERRGRKEREKGEGERGRRKGREGPNRSSNDILCTLASTSIRATVRVSSSVKEVLLKIEYFSALTLSGIARQNTIIIVVQALL